MTDNTIFYSTQIIDKYEIITKIGNGSYGEIFSAINLNNNDVHVLKILKKEKKFEHSNLNELKILKKLKKSHMAIRTDKKELIPLIQDNFFFNNHRIFAMKKYNINLYQEYKKKKFSISEINKITRQVLKGLDFLKLNKIVHGDLKPENILFYNNESFRTIICDFGLSTDLECLKDTDKKNYNIQSIWYRAPEIIFGLDYDYNIEIWSLGCIIFEIYFRKPLFTSKKNQQLFDKIFSFVGSPKQDFVKLNKKTQYYLKIDCEPIFFIEERIKEKMILYNEDLLLRCYDETLQNFILGTITWESKNRLNVQQALQMFKN